MPRITTATALPPEPAHLPTPVRRHFGVAIIDGISELLTESFRLRYQVYCLERQFLAAADYPRGLEVDEFDSRAVHVGALDRTGHLAGTARVILPTDGSLPTLEHSDLSALPKVLWGPSERWVEVSRLSVSRNYGRQEDGQEASASQRGDVLLAVSKAVYFASKRVQATHWLVSIERSLARLLIRSGFPFRQVGPQFDYLGAVAPYSMDLAEFEAGARSGRYPQVADFVRPIEEHDEQPPATDGFAVPLELTTAIDQLISADA